MYRSREWILDRIRQDSGNNPGLPVHVLAARNRVSQATVAAALSLPEPARAKEHPRSVLDPVKTPIDLMLLEEQTRPPEHRYTIKVILERLKTEHGFTCASYSTVRDHVRARRIQLAQGRTLQSKS